MGKLLLFLASIVLLPMALIYPGWRKADQGKMQGAAVLFLPLMGIVLWGALIFAGLGAQSMSNLIEVYIVCAMAVSIAYIKFYLFDYKFQSAWKSTVAACAMLAIAVIALRMLMPVLPE